MNGLSLHYILTTVIAQRYAGNRHSAERNLIPKQDEKRLRLCQSASCEKSKWHGRIPWASWSPVEGCAMPLERRKAPYPVYGAQKLTCKKLTSIRKRGA